MNDEEMDFVIKLIKNLNKIYPHYDVKCEFPKRSGYLSKIPDLDRDSPCRLTITFGNCAGDLKIKYEN